MRRSRDATARLDEEMFRHRGFLRLRQRPVNRESGLTHNNESLTLACNSTARSPMAKAFASQADLQEKTHQLRPAVRACVRVHRGRRSEHRHRDRRRRRAGRRHAGHAGDGAGRAAPHSHRHRQAGQVCRADALPRGARARRIAATRRRRSSPARTRTISSSSAARRTCKARSSAFRGSSAPSRACRD